MMTCDQASFLLERRWDGALQSHEEATLDEHLHTCAACREEAEAIRLADAAFLDLPDMEPPLDIVAAVASRIQDETPAEPARGWFWGGVAVLAALFTAILHFGITLPASWFDKTQHPAVAMAVTGISALAHRAGEILAPYAIYAKGLTPLLAVVVPVVVLLVVVETGVFGLWMMKRAGGHAASRA